NVIRTVGAYEAAGVAALHIEDQVAPKKCGHMDGKQVIPAAEMAEKIRAAADVLFIEAVVSETEAGEVTRAFPGVQLLFNWAEGGRTPPLDLGYLRRLGYQIVIFPIGTLLAATAAMRRILREIAVAGT